MNTDTPATLHSLRRTSPKGAPFMGICVLCGQENLTLSSMNERCENLRGVTQEEALIEAINDGASR